MKIRKSTKVFVYVVLGLASCMILFPIYITLMTAMKTPAETARSFIAPAASLNLTNIKTVVSHNDYWKAFLNTVYVTAFVLVGNTALFPMMSYAISRSMDHSKAYKAMYFYVLMGMFIPFQVKMIPIVKVLGSMDMLNPTGLAIFCIASSTYECVFLYVGYMSSIPRELEEAAYIDGATTAQTFFRIIVPLLKPVIATNLIKDGLWMWNDYELPLITLNKSSSFWTLSLFATNYKSVNLVDYGPMFSAYLMQMIPVLIFYLIMQKHIIGGLTAGAVKS